MNFPVFVQFLLGFAIIFDASIAWFVLLKNPRGAVNQAYFGMVFWITIWQLTNFVYAYSSIPKMLFLIIDRLAYASAVLLVASAAYFVAVYSYKRHLYRYFIFLCCIGLSMALISMTRLIVIEEITKNHFRFGWFYPYFAWYVIIGMITIVGTLILAYLKEKNIIVKSQLHYIIVGFLFPLVLGGLTNLFIPLLEYFFLAENHYLTSLQSIGPATTTVLSAITAYAIIRHRLMDIKVVIRRSMLAVGAYVIISAALLTPLLILRARYFAFLPQNSVITWVLAIAFLILLFKLLYSITSYLIRKVIKRQQFDFHKWRPDQEWALGKIETPEKFARLCAQKIMKKLPVEHFFFVTYDHPSRSFATIFPTDRKEFFDLNEQWIQPLTTNPRRIRRDQIAERTQTPQQRHSLEKLFDHFHAEYCLPLKYQRPELLGVIFIGKRIDGNPFTTANEDFLHEIHCFAAPNQWGILTIYNFNRDNIEDDQHLDPRIHARLAKMKNKIYL